MRFAWLQKNATIDVIVKPERTYQLILVAYNLVWWIPIVLPFLGIIDYSTGFVAFTIITIIRLIANLYRNNVLTLEQAIRFPFRSP